jgi:hypothetical protein
MPCPSRWPSPSARAGRGRRGGAAPFVPGRIPGAAAAPQPGSLDQGNDVCFPQLDGPAQASEAAGRSIRVEIARRLVHASGHDEPVIRGEPGRRGRIGRIDALVGGGVGRAMEQGVESGLETARSEMPEQNRFKVLGMHVSVMEHPRCGIGELQERSLK